MDFLKKLIETERSAGFRMFQGIDMDNNVQLSIQASGTHYCTPRKTLEDLAEYTKMELAIFKNDEWSNVLEVISNKELADKFENYDDGQVYGYVPVELLEELYQALA